jgi:hypothetical protein
MSATPSLPDPVVGNYDKKPLLTAEQAKVRMPSLFSTPDNPKPDRLSALITMAFPQMKPGATDRYFEGLNVNAGQAEDPYANVPQAARLSAAASALFQR